MNIIPVVVKAIDKDGNVLRVYKDKVIWLPQGCVLVEITEISDTCPEAVKIRMEVTLPRIIPST